jgi:uncharacterized protein (TIRG00374 family)
MPRSGANDRGDWKRPNPGFQDPFANAQLEPRPDEEADAEEPRFFDDPKRLAQTALMVLVVVVAIYFLLPKLVEGEDVLQKLGRADPVWLAVALGFSVAMFAAYVALFRGVVGERVRLRWKDSYDITMAGLAATRLFSAGGAGGIVLTYWALRKAGLPRKETAARMVAFLVVLYAVYMLTLLINGTLLRTGVFDAPAPAGLTVVPAAFAGGVIVLFLLFALIPGDLERRFSQASQERFWGRMMRRIATLPSTLGVGVRQALAYVRDLSRGGLAVLGAVGFWAANIGILWAAFQAFEVEVPLAIVVQGFFLGMFANLLPLPGGVGGVDAGMIGAFLLFDVHPYNALFASVLIYRAFAFWLPIPPGIVAFFQLRGTVRRWERERAEPGVGTDSAESLPGAAITSESKV